MFMPTSAIIAWHEEQAKQCEERIKSTRTAHALRIWVETAQLHRQFIVKLKELHRLEGSIELVR
jgi:hypothetical protein